MSKQIVAAVTRKLLHLCFGVFKNAEPFNPNQPAGAPATPVGDTRRLSLASSLAMRGIPPGPLVQGQRQDAPSRWLVDLAG